MRPVADEDVLLVLEATSPDLVELADERAGIDNDSIADDADRVLIEDPRGNKVENVLLVFDLHRVAGVRSPLVANDHIGPGRQYVHDLPLTLISPLETDHTAVAGGLNLIRTAHRCSLLRRRRRALLHRQTPALLSQISGVSGRDLPPRIIRAKSSKRKVKSLGPGAASGWNCTVKRGSSLW